MKIKTFTKTRVNSNPAEENSWVSIPLTLRPSQAKQLSAYCEENNIPRLTFIKLLIEKYTGINMFHEYSYKIEFEEEEGKKV